MGLSLSLSIYFRGHFAYEHIETCIHTVRERLVKQARNKYLTNNKVESFLGNTRNNRTGVARGVFYVGRIYSLLGNRCVLCSVVRPETNEKPTIIESSVASQMSSCEENA
jgi:hypothetical protein